MRTTEVPDLAREVGAAKLGDRRLEARLGRIAERISDGPERSFPRMFEDDADLEGLYRFLSNEKVAPERLLEPHIAATAARVRTATPVLVVHDTSGFSFGGEAPREGLGRMKKGGQGFYAHVALAVEQTSGVPLGVLGLETICRTEPPVPYPDCHSKRHERPREFERWHRVYDDVHRRVGEAAVVHVMDREADVYALIAAMQGNSARFVIRCRTDRVLDTDGEDGPRTLFQVLPTLPPMGTYEVAVRRKRQDRMMRLRKAPGRMQRLAKVQVSATRVQAVQPPYSAGKSKRDTGLPPSLPLNVVHVREVEAPPGEEPLDWKLLTTEPIATTDDLAAIVGIYRRRWIIEEFFRALKSGCAVERRQLESKQALLNAFALFIPAAWRLLVLGLSGREAIESPPQLVLSSRQVEILRRRRKVALSRVATPRELMLAVAAEGGHIQNNGDPGWQVLGRGYEALLLMEVGWKLAYA